MLGMGPNTPNIVIIEFHVLPLCSVGLAVQPGLVPPLLKPMQEGGGAVRGDLEFTASDKYTTTLGKLAQLFAIVSTMQPCILAVEREAM